MLPKSVRADLQIQLDARRSMHERDLARGVARVELPDAMERKYPSAARELGWQFVFASRQLSHCPRSGRLGRHHIHQGSVQRAVGIAGVAAGLAKRIHCHTFRMASAYYYTSLRMGYFQGSSSPSPYGVRPGTFIVQINCAPLHAIGSVCRTPDSTQHHGPTANACPRSSAGSSPPW